MSVGRDGRQGWSRRSEEAWERIFARHVREAELYERLSGRERPEADEVARVSCQGDE